MRSALWLAVAGCSGALPGPSPDATKDGDGDGWTVSDGDCDDGAADVNPHAIDTPGDGVDQDCDGADDPALGLRGVAPGDLVVTEVMMDPVGVPADLGEWFEIHNATDVPIDLDGLQVLDFGRDDFVVGASVVVGPGRYVVLGTWSVPEENGGVVVDYRYEADYGLSNSEDAIRLLFDGLVLETVAWDARYPLQDGYSMTLRRGAGADGNDDPSAWCLPPTDEIYGVGGRGTPGAQNSECPPPFDGLGVADLGEGDLVITEVMQNPSVVDGDLGEWFEVYNAASEDVDLDGLLVSDGLDDDVFEVFSTLIVPAGGYVVFGSFADPAVNGGVPVDWEWRWDYGLANSGQTIELRHGTRLLDAITYDNGLTFPDPTGASMSLSGDVLDVASNDVGAMWCEGSIPYGGGDLGTPGAPNPPCVDARQGAELRPGDLVVTEILKDTLAVDGDFGEWFELQNTTHEVIDLVGLTLRDDGGDSHVVATSVRVEPGAHVVLGRVADPATNGGAPVDYAFGVDMKLGNDDDEIVIAFGATVIDAVRYDAVVFPSPEGASMSLDPTASDATSNDLGSNWCVATTPYGDGDLGTPGGVNPPC